ncbi:hypothetical protein Taro_021477 [Colocasia esculenta]|uniref:Uncharacterized protein n=1 Tax=Colocasia esculenta TaxID=4460 RepID=A0A843V1C8_COLES|nr:hypothetical protein [Colocasia esculenta]
MQIFCKGCVDTALTGADTMPQTQGKIKQNWSSSVDTMLQRQDQLVSTQCFKYKAKWLSSVDTRSGSVDTRDSPQKTFWPIWDSVSTLAQVVSTLETAPKKPSGQSGTVCRH